MIDAPQVLLEYLTAQSALTALASTRIWAERTEPIVGYQPATGPALVYRSRGGVPVDYLRGNLIKLSFQFKCYGVDEATANQLYRKLYDVLDNQPSTQIPSALMSIAGQTISEPATGWIYVLTFYEILFKWE